MNNSKEDLINMMLILNAKASLTYQGLNISTVIPTQQQLDRLHEQADEVLATLDKMIRNLLKMEG